MNKKDALQYCQLIGCSGIHPDRCPGDVDCTILSSFESDKEMLEKSVKAYKEGKKFCYCCQKGINTLIECPDCHEYVCQDCLDGVHICES